MRFLCCFALFCISPFAVAAGNPQDDSQLYPVLSPDVAETNYMLKQVEELGDKGNEYEQYNQECNERGICRLTPKPTGTVVYETSFGRQTVVYPEGQNGNY